MQKIELKRWFDNEQAVADYRQGLALLHRSGVLNVMALIGIPQMFAQGSDINIMASQGAWSNGYHTALEHLKFFVEVFEPKVESVTSAPSVDYNGIAEAVRRGDLTKEEADKLL